MLPIRTEKSPFPAVIVTPSSPSSANDFAIAYLPPLPKASVRERLGTYAAPLQRHARMTILLFIIFFVLLCHFITHRAATRFGVLTSSETGTDVHVSFLDWFSMRSFLSDIMDGGSVIDKAAETVA